ncbi:MAG: hypothetical protein ACRDCA_28575 [Serratia sp. (in: enterobacteria)]|uniref:hypothetical protein n=1 Tax=Serratia sp. (in: enterobacteria) TaxID=616 RepID=UPI003F2E2FC0
MNKQEFLQMFQEYSDVRNAKVKAERAGYEVQVEGRGRNAVYHVNKIVPDGYDAHLTLEEVKRITGQSKRNRALAMFNGGHNKIVGKQVWYKKNEARCITELDKESRIRYLFTVRPELADEYTYAYIGKLVGLSSSSVGYYIRKIVEKDQIKKAPHRKFRTSFVRLSTKQVYTIPWEDHVFFTEYFGKGYYNSKFFLDMFFLKGYMYRRYQEKPLHLGNIGEMNGVRPACEYTFLDNEKSPSDKLELQEIIKLLKDLN